MTPRLTDEQRHALEERGGKPVEVVDPSTSAVFYLVSREQFDCIRSLIEPDAVDLRQTYLAQQQAVQGIWDDPALDIYNEADAPPATP